VILFNTYQRVTTTIEVAKEYGDALPAWVEIESPKDRSRQQILELQLDQGEASAIALALETPDSTIILDDYKARRIAEKLGLEITGTLGVIIKAKQKGVIKSVKPYLAKLKKRIFVFLLNWKTKR
jgi:predicted nucleic acid-binding protein